MNVQARLSLSLMCFIFLFAGFASDSTIEAEQTSTAILTELSSTQTATPLLPTSSHQEVISYLASYCGPEIENSINWIDKVRPGVFLKTEGGVAIQLICNWNTSYYFAISGLEAGKYLQPTNVKVKAPTGDYLLDLVETGLTDVKGNLVLTLTFNGDEPIGQYDLSVITNEGLEASVEFFTSPMEPQKMSVQVEEIYDQALAYYSLGEFEEAISLYEEVIALHPKHSSALNNLAWTLAYNLDTDYEIALDYVLQSVELSPNKYNHDTLALVQLKLDQYQNAIFHYNIALFFDDTYTLSYRGRGDAYYEIGDLEAALSDYKRYLALEPYADDRGEIESRFPEAFEPPVEDQDEIESRFPERKTFQNIASIFTALALITIIIIVIRQKRKSSKDSEIKPSVIPNESVLLEETDKPTTQQFHTPTDPRVALEDGKTLLSHGKREEAIAHFIHAFKTGSPQVRDEAKRILKEIGEIKYF